MIFVGIDPGVHGGIAVVDESSVRCLATLPIEGARAAQRLDVAKFLAVISEHVPIEEALSIAVEQQQVIHVGAAVSIKTTVRLMRIEGEIVGSLRVYLGRRKGPGGMILVPPKLWQTILPGKPRSRKERKAAAFQLAGRSFAGTDGLPGKVDEHTVAALAMALWARNQRLEAAKSYPAEPPA